jgi:hypothetical protein
MGKSGEVVLSSDNAGEHRTFIKVKQFRHQILD